MEIVEKAIEDQLKEKEMFKGNVNKTAREIASMMGLRIDNINFSVSVVNKDRQTEVLFKEIQEANAEKLINGQKLKSLKVTPSVEEEEADEVIDVIMDVGKKSTTGEVPVSQEERGNQEELSRGIVSSDGTDEESGSEKTPTVVAKKEKSAQGGKGKKGSKSKKKNKK
ncbi:hypothetical protein RhiirC2_789778 [Rhizophagus irregularis]|uniref:Uncharacterized protein n=1 Tax=Rhizophagus irregularis TaxID=588596 RepID=A0A2N1MMH4_9GLOM|nr:hypothetical protein RhiirC2_789778 [Rhizophagus irregularis]